MFKHGLIVFLLLSIQYNNPFSQTFDKCHEKWNQLLGSDELRSEYISLIGLCNDDLKVELKKVIDTNTYLSYKKARAAMFSYVDNDDGIVCGVYSKKCIKTTGIPNHKIMNTEHSWCQSWGAKGIAKSDLHHLFPTLSDVNSLRNNHPFCEVTTVKKYSYQSIYGLSVSHTLCFEPPDQHKGMLARSMFYFAIRYQLEINSEQEYFFRKWNNEYPVELEEQKRNKQVYAVQKNYNPFIHHPKLTKLIDDF